MDWPQIAYICLIIAKLAVNFAKNGEPMGEYSAGMALVGAGITIFLLCAGGFFK